MAATFVLAVPLFFARGRTPHVGSVVAAPITVTPADARLLECALARRIGEYACAYADENTRTTPRPAPRNLIQPYLTTDRVFYLVPGLFENEAVRRHVERSVTGERFTAECDLRLVEELSDFSARFDPRGAFQPQKTPVWLAEPVSCRVP